jgi:HEAT repeat protein
LITLLVLLFTAIRTESVDAQSLERLNRLVQAQAPSAAATAFREGRDLIRDSEWAKAEARFNRFLTEFPKDREVAAAIYWLAFSMKQQDKFPAADAALTRLIEQYPSSTWANDARAMRVEIAPRLKNSQVIEQGVNEANEEIRLAALQSLFEARPERALVIAGDILKAPDSSRLMKEGALALLADSETKEAIPVLLQVARNDSDPRLRRRAVEALGNIEDDAALEPLRTLALQSTDLTMARAAVSAIADHEGSARKVLLEIAASNAPVEVRAEAISELDDFEDDPTLVDDVLKMLSAEKDPRLQESLVELLEDLEHPRASAALTELARTASNVQIRRQAIEALADREDDAAVASLIQLYDAEKDERLKEDILEALGDSEQRAALMKLTQIAAGDSSLRLRRRALEHIGDSDDPEAIKFLEDLLRKK